MREGIRIGFSMHPRWINTNGLKTFIEPLRRAGLSALEFELDDQMDLWADSLQLMDIAIEQGLELSFHAPFRAPHSLIGFAGDQRQVLEMEYQPLFEIAERWAQRTGTPRTVVVHAAHSKIPTEPGGLVDDTNAFLQWILDTFPNLHLALENNHPSAKGDIKVGVHREEVLRIIDRFPPSRVGICWDMGHDYLRHQQDEPSLEWLSRVIHVHVHDVDQSDQDHYPLGLGYVPYQTWLQSLKQTGMKGIVVLELKGGLLKGWSPNRVGKALVRSIEAIAREVT